MGSIVPGKLLVVIGVFIGLCLMLTGYSGTVATALWVLAGILVVLGVFNWGVK
jgi:hypothetical protein